MCDVNVQRSRGGNHECPRRSTSYTAIVLPCSSRDCVPLHATGAPCQQSTVGAVRCFRSPFLKTRMRAPIRASRRGPKRVQEQMWTRGGLPPPSLRIPPIPDAVHGGGFSSFDRFASTRHGGHAQAFKDKEELAVGTPHYSPPHTRNLRRPSKQTS